MRHIARLLFLVVAFCSAIVFADEGRITVAVSLQPYATLVKMVGGDYVNVVTLLPPGADPHNFEPKPAVIKAFRLLRFIFLTALDWTKFGCRAFWGQTRMSKSLTFPRISNG